MNIYYFGNKTLEEYKDNIDKNLKKYKEGQLNFVKASDFLKDPKIKLNPIELDLSSKDPSDSDFENIKRFYLAFKNLKDNQATEEKLWAGLCHYEPFWKYMKYRWNCETEENVLERYFFNQASRSIFFNGLARLWWYGRMTYDEKSKDPFELTKYICEQNLTLKGLLPMTLAFSHNREIYKVFIRSLMNFERKNKLTGKEHELVRKYMNLLGGKILLDSLTPEELEKKILEYLKSLVKKRP